MDIIQSIILGIIQGLAEFLPISSSAHLIIIPWILGWKEHTQVFDIALHMGTLLAIVIFFFKDYINIVSNGFTKPRSEQGKEPHKRIESGQATASAARCSPMEIHSKRWLP